MKTIVPLLLALTLFGTAQAESILDWIFPPTRIAGTVGYVQTNHFMLVSPDNQYLRIFLKPGQIMPSTILPGMVITGTVTENDQRMVILETLDGVQSPTGEVVQPVAPNQ
jgi:hypothetical protein